MGGGRGGGGGPVPRDFTHNFCCYGNRSVCLYLLRATASSWATKSGNFGRALLECGEQAMGRFTLKKRRWGTGVTERGVCKYALAWCLFSPGCPLGHVCVQHPAQPPPEFQLELPGRAQYWKSKKVRVREVRIQQSQPPECGGTTKCVSYPSSSFACSETSRMGESVESEILSLVKHRLTHKLLLTLIATRHRQESVGRVSHWKWHIYIAPLSTVLWHLCFHDIRS